MSTLSSDALPLVRYVAALFPGDPLLPFVPPGLVCALTLLWCLSVLSRVNNGIVATTLGVTHQACGAPPLPPTPPSPGSPCSPLAPPAPPLTSYSKGTRRSVSSS